MQEIEIGDYVRTRGIIGRLIRIEFDKIYVSLRYVLVTNKNREVFVSKPYIEKYNKNIKELLKVGDYINGSKLLSIDYAEDREGNCDKLHYYYSFEDSEKDVNEYYEELNIKSIVTSEQFKNIEYKI